MRAGSSKCPSSSESISSSWLLAFNTRKLSVPRMEAISRHRKMFFLLLSERKGQRKIRLSFSRSIIAKYTTSHENNQISLTRYLCPSIPVKIDVEIAKQHAVKKKKTQLRGS